LLIWLFAVDNYKWVLGVAGGKIDSYATIIED